MSPTITPAERRLAQCLHDDIAVLRYYGKGLTTAVSHKTIPRIFGPQDIMVRQPCCDMPIPTKLSTHIMSDRSAKSRAASLRTERREIVTGGAQGRKTRESGRAGFCMLDAWAIDSKPRCIVFSPSPTPAHIGTYQAYARQHRVSVQLTYLAFSHPVIQGCPAPHQDTTNCLARNYTAPFLQAFCSCGGTSVFWRAIVRMLTFCFAVHRDQLR